MISFLILLDRESIVVNEQLALPAYQHTISSFSAGKQVTADDMSVLKN